MKVAAASADKYKTNAEYAAAVSKDRAAQIGDALLGVRKVIGDHLNATFPTTVVDLTPELRQRFKAEYNRIAAILEGIQ
jgi:hypothetical protein